MRSRACRRLLHSGRVSLRRPLETYSGALRTRSRACRGIPARVCSSASHSPPRWRPCPGLSVRRGDERSSALLLVVGLELLEGAGRLTHARRERVITRLIPEGCRLVQSACIAILHRRTVAKVVRVGEAGAVATRETVDMSMSGRGRDRRGAHSGLREPRRLEPPEESRECCLPALRPEAMPGRCGDARVSFALDRP
jgi:hypothetical protein